MPDSTYFKEELALKGTIGDHSPPRLNLPEAPLNLNSQVPRQVRKPRSETSEAPEKSSLASHQISDYHSYVDDKFVKRATTKTSHRAKNRSVLLRPTPGNFSPAPDHSVWSEIKSDDPRFETPKRSPRKVSRHKKKPSQPLPYEQAYPPYNPTGLIVPTPHRTGRHGIGTWTPHPNQTKLPQIKGKAGEDVLPRLKQRHQPLKPPHS